MATVQKQTKQEKKPVTLTPDEQAAFKQGLQSEATGVDYSLEEVFQFARKRRKEWMNDQAKSAA